MKSTTFEKKSREKIPLLEKYLYILLNIQCKRLLCYTSYMERIEKFNKKHKVCMTIFYSFIFALGINFFIKPAGILSAGMTGIVQIADFYIDNLSFSSIYILLNIPGIIIGIFYLGKKFTFYSVISILTVSIATELLPIYQVTTDVMLGCVFGGLLMGYGLGGLLKYGSSTGGTDFYAMYLYQEHGISFAKVSTIINLGIVCFSGVLFGVEIALFTILSIVVRQAVMHSVYRNHSKLTVWIIGDELEDLNEYIVHRLHRGTTVFNEASGGFSQERKQVIMTTLDTFEYQKICRSIDTYGENIFICTTQTDGVYGNYPINRKKV